MTFLLTFLLSLIGTKIAIPLLRALRVMDNPNARSNHKAPVPRGGGVALVISSLIFLGLAGIDLKIILTGVMLAIISFIDDMRGLSARIRLLAQLLAVILAISSLHIRIFPEFIPLFIEWGFVALAWIWFINLTNFMDGIDGITSMQVVMMCIGISLVNVDLGNYALIIVAATLGFFYFNRPPAKVFMGDVGSVTLGFLMGYLLLSLAANGAWASALIIPAYYLSDATITLVKRVLKGEKVWQAHSQHAYQQAVRNGQSHAQVVGKITLLNAVLLALAVIANINLPFAIASVVLAYMASFCFIRRLTQTP